MKMDVWHCVVKSLNLYVRTYQIFLATVSFFEMDSKRPSLCIKMMHMALFIKQVSKVFKVLLQYHHGSIKVVAKSSQRKKEQAIKSLCDISNAPRVQSSTLIESNNRHQMIVSSIQKLVLLHRKKV
jgi:hypothetical protein